MDLTWIKSLRETNPKKITQKKNVNIKRGLIKTDWIVVKSNNNKKTKGKEGKNGRELDHQTTSVKKDQVSTILTQPNKVETKNRFEILSDIEDSEENVEYATKLESESKIEARLKYDNKDAPKDGVDNVDNKNITNSKKAVRFCQIVRIKKTNGYERHQMIKDDTERHATWRKPTYCKNSVRGGIARRKYTSTKKLKYREKIITLNESCFADRIPWSMGDETTVECNACKKHFKNTQGLKIHRGTCNKRFGSGEQFPEPLSASTQLSQGSKNQQRMDVSTSVLDDTRAEFQSQDLDLESQQLLGQKEEDESQSESEKESQTEGQGNESEEDDSDVEPGSKRKKRTRGGERVDTAKKPRVQEDDENDYSRQIDEVNNSLDDMIQDAEVRGQINKLNEIHREEKASLQSEIDELKRTVENLENKEAESEDDESQELVKKLKQDIVKNEKTIRDLKNANKKLEKNKTGAKGNNDRATQQLNVKLKEMEQKVKKYKDAKALAESNLKMAESNLKDKESRIEDLTATRKSNEQLLEMKDQEITKLRGEAITLQGKIPCTKIASQGCRGKQDGCVNSHEKTYGKPRPLENPRPCYWFYRKQNCSKGDQCHAYHVDPDINDAEAVARHNKAIQEYIDEDEKALKRDQQGKRSTRSENGANSTDFNITETEEDSNNKMEWVDEGHEEIGQEGAENAVEEDYWEENNPHPKKPSPWLTPKYQHEEGDETLKQDDEGVTMEEEVEPIISGNVYARPEFGMKGYRIPKVKAKQTPPPTQNKLINPRPEQKQRQATGLINLRPEAQSTTNQRGKKVAQAGIPGSRFIRGRGGRIRGSRGRGRGRGNVQQQQYYEQEEYYDEYEEEQYGEEEYYEYPQEVEQQPTPVVSKRSRPARGVGNERGVRYQAALPPHVAGQGRGTMNQQVRAMTNIYKAPSYQATAGQYGQGQVRQTRPQTRGQIAQHQGAVFRHPRPPRGRSTRGGRRQLR